MRERWFIFDLGNVVVKLDYERVIANLCADAALPRSEMIALLEQPGGYRDLERGAVSFAEMHRWLAGKAGYRGDLRRLREVWTDFFEGPMPGIFRSVPSGCSRASSGSSSERMADAARL